MADETTTAKSLTIGNVTLAVKAPYAEGHTLNGNEAGVLNQTYLENVRNNAAGKLKAAEKAFREDPANAATVAAEGFSWSPTAEQLAEIQGYADSYVFGARVSRTSEPVDPTEREARRIARDIVDTKLREKGVKKAGLGEGIYDQMLDRVAASDDVQKEAKRRVTARGKIGEDALADLLGAPAEQAAAA